MKKVSAMMIVSLLASLSIIVPTLATPHFTPPTQQKQLQFKSDAERAAYTDFYNEKTDAVKKLALGKEFLKKFPDSDFAPSVEGVNIKAMEIIFNQHLGAYYQAPGPSAAKLEPLIAIGDEYLSKQPDKPFYVGHLALATGYGVLADFYKDLDKSKAYAEKAIQLLASETAPPAKDWAPPLTPEQWGSFRTEGLSKLNQYLGIFILRQTTPDPEQAIACLTKAAENKTWPTAKDPNTYLQRAHANTIIYTKLSGEYSSLSADDKTSDKGKDALAKVDPVVDKIIDDLARALALLKPEMKVQVDDAKERLTEFWKYRHDGKLEGMAELIKYYQADPTAPPPAKPATPAPSSQKTSGGSVL